MYLKHAAIDDALIERTFAAAKRARTKCFISASPDLGTQFFDRPEFQKRTVATTDSVPFGYYRYAGTASRQCSARHLLTGANGGVPASAGTHPDEIEAFQFGCDARSLAESRKEYYRSAGIEVDARELARLRNRWPSGQAVLVAARCNCC